MTEWQFQPGRAGRLGRDRIFLARRRRARLHPEPGASATTRASSASATLPGSSRSCSAALRPHPCSRRTTSSTSRSRSNASQPDGANAQLSGGIFRAFHEGGDTEAAARNCRQYGDYDGLIYGYELTSALCAREDAPAPEVDNPVCDYVPVVRSGRRAPNLWLDESRTRSVLDWNGLGYTAVLGAHVDAAPWQAAVDATAAAGFPIQVKRMPEVLADSPYDNGGIVLMRPDGIVATHWHAASVHAGEETARLTRTLPTTQ